MPSLLDNPEKIVLLLRQQKLNAGHPTFHDDVLEAAAQHIERLLRIAYVVGGAEPEDAISELSVFLPGGEGYCLKDGARAAVGDTETTDQR